MSNVENSAQWRRPIRTISVTGAGLALLSIVEALILVFHAHRCPPGWTQFDFDAPVGAASLIVTVPLLLTLVAALFTCRSGRGMTRRAVSVWLAVAVTLTVVATGIVLLLGWGVISNLSSSTNGCLTF